MLSCRCRTVYVSSHTHVIRQLLTEGNQAWRDHWLIYLRLGSLRPVARRCPTGPNPGLPLLRPIAGLRDQWPVCWSFFFENDSASIDKSRGLHEGLQKVPPCCPTAAPVALLLWNCYNRPLVHTQLLLRRLRVQNCRTCSRDCGPVWHRQSVVCASTNRRVCRSRRQCPVRDGRWRFVAAAQGGGSDPSAFWDWLECPFYDGLCLKLSEAYRMFLGAVASLKNSGLANRQLRIT